MTIFKKHIISTIFLGLYFVWWTFVIYWFDAGSAVSPQSCGAANGTIVMLTFLFIALYILMLIIKIAITNRHERWDYLKFLGLVFIPAIIMTLFLL